VISYNRRTEIAEPSPSDVNPLKVGSLRQLFSTSSFATLLLPANVSSLFEGTSQIS
jgi:hypothetical protein